MLYNLMSRCPGFGTLQQQNTPTTDNDIIQSFQVVGVLRLPRGQALSVAMLLYCLGCLCAHCPHVLR